MPSREGAFVPREQIETETNIEEVEKPLGDLKEDLEKVGNFKYFLDLVTSGIIESQEELIVRLNARTNSSGYYITERGGEFIKKGDIIGNFGALSRSNKADPTKKISDPEVVSLFTELYRLSSDNRIPEEVRSNLLRLYKTHDSGDAERLEALLEASGDPELRDQVTALLKKSRTYRRSLDLKNEFYARLDESNEFSVPNEVLASYEEKSLEDRVLINSLRAKALSKRRGNMLLEFSKELNVDSPNFDAAIARLEVLLKSPVDLDRQAGIIALKSVYKLELARYKQEVIETVRYDADFTEVRRQVNSLPLRPTVGEFDYVETQIQVKEQVAKKSAKIDEFKRLEKANEIRQAFPQGGDVILAKISELPEETTEDIAIKKQLLSLFKSFTAANNPGEFDERFAEEIISRIEGELQGKFISPERGKNKDALAYLRERFVSVIFPLVESFRDDPRTKEVMGDFLDVDTEGGKYSNPRSRYIIRLRELEKQRPLTDVERNYLQSVELLSVFNPYLIGAAAADNEVTREFLYYHFQQLSRETTSNLKDGDYVPLIQVGLGPNGLASLGEIVRNNPELIRQTLVVDEGEEPGGPFAIPRGKAWDLNSANRRGKGGYELPDSSNGKELKTVRAFGSPLRWYPGERTTKNKSVRQGSINTTVDYLPVPDDLSNLRYPTNEDLQLILSLQAAMLANKMALRTRYVEARPNPDPEGKGDTLVTLEINESGKTRRVQIQTDGRFLVAGLGDASYGFEIKGKRAERVLEDSKNSKGFPKLSRTLESFRALAGRSEKKSTPGQTLVIYGGGNSADTLVEYIGNLFQGNNPLVRDITKIYVVTEGSLSSRPRYASVNDLKPRNGNGNLVELVKTKVSDVGFAEGEETKDIKDRKMVVYDTNDNIIVDNQNEPIVADAVIAASGFKPSLDKVFSAYLKDGQNFRGTGENSPLEPLVLPTNPDVAVADTLKDDPNTLFLGTASRPRFDSAEKLDQLPVEAREALLRNGAENAVAIGFRAPDTQAAVNVWLNSRDVRLEPSEKRTREDVDVRGNVQQGASVRISNIVEIASIPDYLKEESLLLSALLAYRLGNEIELSSSADGTKKPFNGDITFELAFDKTKNEFSLVFSDGKKVGSLNARFWQELTSAWMDPEFQKYALSALRKRRRNPRLEIIVSYKNGKMNPRGTFVQSI